MPNRSFDARDPRTDEPAGVKFILLGAFEFTQGKTTCASAAQRAYLMIHGPQGRLTATKGRANYALSCLWRTRCHREWVHLATWSPAARSRRASSDGSLWSAELRPIELRDDQQAHRRVDSTATTSPRAKRARTKSSTSSRLVQPASTSRWHRTPRFPSRKAARFRTLRLARDLVQPPVPQVRARSAGAARDQRGGGGRLLRSHELR